MQLMNSNTDLFSCQKLLEQFSKFVSNFRYQSSNNHILKVLQVLAIFFCAFINEMQNSGFFVKKKTFPTKYLFWFPAIKQEACMPGMTYIWQQY